MWPTLCLRCATTSVTISQRGRARYPLSFRLPCDCTKVRSTTCGAARATNRILEEHFGQVRPRTISPGTLPSTNTKMTARNRTSIEIGLESLSLLRMPQLVHDSQAKAIVSALKYCAGVNNPQTLSQLLHTLEGVLDRHGLDPLMGGDSIEFFLARPRLFEVGMAINRLRSQQRSK